MSDPQDAIVDPTIPAESPVEPSLPAYRPTKEEFEHLSNALVGYSELMMRDAAQATTPEARAAAQQGFAVARDVLGRLNQIIHSGEGLSRESLGRYKKRVEAALVSRDVERVATAYADLLAAATRLEPDPARWCAQVCVALVGQAQGQVATKGACEVFLGEHGALGELVALEKDIAGGSPLTAAEVVGYLKEWVETGLENARQGLEPWPRSEGA